MDNVDPMTTFASASGLGSLAGLAHLLRSGKPISVRNILSTILNSAISSLVIALIWFSYFRANDNIYFLVGISALAGLGGTSVADLLVTIFKRRINEESSK